VNVPAARLVFSDADRAAILALIDESLRSGSLTLGPHTQALEAAFAARHQADYAVAVSSGTSALEIVLRALAIGGSEVVVPANTFYATAAAVVHAGGLPRFADVDATTLALSAQTVENAITPRTAGVIMVHIGGVISPEILAIRALCQSRGLFLLEDAAHAHGCSFDGQPAGSFGVAGTFSFYPTKVITAGEGGMIVTADQSLHDEARVYRDQGKAGFLGGEHIRLGSAWRMSEIHAAVALIHLRRLDEFIAARRAVARQYDEALADVDGITPLRPPQGCGSNYYKYVALLDPRLDRAAVKQATRERGVSLSGEVYARALHTEPVFADLPGDSLPVAEDVCARQICLPVHSDMTAVEVEQVINALREAVASLALTMAQTGS
jgi:dTDP-4-amino-4,6-dideoxygalactose transaminase